MITQEMKVADVLKQHPETLDVFLEASAAFQKLKNPLMRKVLAPRVTVAQAAKIADLEPANLVAALNTACGLVSDPETVRSEPAPTTVSTLPTERPTMLADLSAEREVLVDVREDIRKNIDPFKKIMGAVKRLQDGQVMHLVNVFEPVPLYEVLGLRGFAHWSEQVGGEWHIYFYPAEKVGVANSGRASDEPPRPNFADDTVIELDVSGLEPPEPMMRILAMLPTLPEGTALRVHHHREPKMLYPHLQDRGFEWITTRLAEDRYRIIIRRVNNG